jgi:hypothetical protein
MRINELLENAHFKSEQFTKQTDNGTEIDYDLVDDLIHYLHNNDEVYRRHLHPAILKCKDKMADGKDSATCKIFKPAVENGYKIYLKQYPIRELPDDVNPKVLKNVCKQLFKDVSKHIKDGTYD